MIVDSLAEKSPRIPDRTIVSRPRMRTFFASTLAAAALLTVGSGAVGAQYTPGNYCERGWTLQDGDAALPESWTPGCNATATIEGLEPSVGVAVVLSRKDEVGGAVYSPYFFPLNCDEAIGFALKNIQEVPFNDLRGFGFNQATGGLNPQFRSFANLWVNTTFPNGTFAKNQVLECQTADNKVLSKQLINVSITLED